MTFGSGYDRYAWMIKMWPVIYGTSSPQFALSWIDWIYYFFVYCWCHLTMLSLPPLVVAYVLAAVLVFSGIVRHRYLIKIKHDQLIITLQTRLGGRVVLPALDEVEGMIHAEETEGAVTYTLGSQQVQAERIVRLKKDLKALLYLLHVVVALVLIGTYSLYLTTAPPVLLAPH